jgi:hypothetical protein
VLQQASGSSYTASNYSNVGSLVSKILADATNEDVIIGFSINHLGPDQFLSSGDVDNGNRQAVLNCIKTVVETASNHIGFVFPYGTAIGAIQDKYKDMADWMTYTTTVSGQLYRSGHLNEGFPCYAAALANLQALFERFYPKYSVLGDVFIPDTTHTVQEHGTPVGVPGDLAEWLSDSRVAQFAAMTANRNKFKINPVKYYG